MSSRKRRDEQKKILADVERRKYRGRPMDDPFEDNPEDPAMYTDAVLEDAYASPSRFMLTAKQCVSLLAALMIVAGLWSIIEMLPVAPSTKEQPSTSTIRTPEKSDVATPQTIATLSGKVTRVEFMRRDRRVGSVGASLLSTLPNGWLITIKGGHSLRLPLALWFVLSEEKLLQARTVRVEYITQEHSLPAYRAMFTTLQRSTYYEAVALDVDGVAYLTPASHAVIAHPLFWVVVVTLLGFGVYTIGWHLFPPKQRTP